MSDGSGVNNTLSKEQVVVKCIAGHGDRVGFDILIRCFCKIDIRKTEDHPLGKGAEIVFSALISLIVCAEMGLIIRTINAETQMIMLLCQKNALNRLNLALELNILNVLHTFHLT